MVQQQRNAFGWFATFDYTLRRYHLGTSTRPHVANMESEASVSIFSESDGEQVIDILPGNKDSYSSIPSLLDSVQAPQKSKLLWKLVVRKNLSAADSYRRE